MNGKKEKGEISGLAKSPNVTRGMKFCSVVVFKEWKIGETQWEPGWTNGPRETAERSVSRLPSVKSYTTQQRGFSGLDFQNKTRNTNKPALGG